MSPPVWLSNTTNVPWKEPSPPMRGGPRISDGVKVLNNVGVLPESSWPYLIQRYRTPIPAILAMEQKKHRARARG